MDFFLLRQNPILFSIYLLIHLLFYFVSIHVLTYLLIRICIYVCMAGARYARRRSLADLHQVVVPVRERADQAGRWPGRHVNLPAYLPAWERGPLFALELRSFSQKSFSTIPRVFKRERAHTLR